MDFLTDDPGVFYMGGVLLVCGFLSGSPCKYTSRGEGGGSYQCQSQP